MRVLAVAIADGNPLQLIEATKAHVPELMTWFPTEHSCRVWGGPQFRFPFTVETFLADSKLTSLASYALVRESAELCAFGQFYLRVGRCHLARLVVAPSHRGQGFGTRLIEMLLREGHQSLGVTESSLFVHVGNTSAIALYERLGFTRASYPEPGLAIPNSLYMISSALIDDASSSSS
jgi:ribosomal protein S18 acetylase RimI-like enzyme